MLIYALRHKKTGKFMPSRLTRNSAMGWSKWEPTEDQQYYDSNPRLFYSSRAANIARSNWSKGVWARGTSTDGDWETGYYEVVDAPRVEKKQNRSIDDIEVVTFNMVELNR